MPTTAIKPQAARAADIRRLSFDAGNGIPNNAAYPAVLARDALHGPHDDHAVRDLLERNGWGGTWTWEVFGYHHFHPDAFEALAVARGAATLALGGPQGERLQVTAGDVMILPPGFGHCQIEKRDGFRICGAYPPGQENYRVIRADDGFDDAILDEIAAVAVPETDPVWGGHAALLKALLG
ncbi:MAG: cupin domain-containing protein [Pararhizobium sp.]